MIKRSHTDDIAFFVAFCVEIYKSAHSLIGAEVSNLFSSLHVFDYLEQNYEVLHTQSPTWILSELENYIKSEQK